MEVTTTKEWNALTYIHFLYHLLVLVMTVFIIRIPIKDYRQLLSWHAILGTLAFMTLTTEAITLFYEDVWYFAWLTRRRKIWIHGSLLGIATVFAVLAVIFEFYRKETRKGHVHFDTVHGTSALISAILMLIAALAGLFAANPQWVSFIRPVWIKLVHNVLGQVAYLIGMVSLCCAVFSNWLVIRQQVSQETRAVWTAVSFFITLWSLGHPVRSLYNQCLAFGDN